MTNRVALGIGSTGPTGPLGPQGPQGPPGLGFDVVAKVTSYTILVGDSGNLITFNGANKIATLPAVAPAEPWAIGIKNLNATPLTVNPNGLQLDGSGASITLVQNQQIFIWSDGANYLLAGQSPLQRASNLSDVSDTGTSRLNLKVPTLAPCAVVATSNVATLTGLPTIDGYTLVAGDHVLLTAQSTGSQNGPWVAAAGAWTRPTSYPAAGVVGARTVAIIQGTIGGGGVWLLQTNTSITVDTTATTWRLQQTPSVVTDSRGSGAGADVPMNGHTLPGLGPLVLQGGLGFGLFADFSTGVPGAPAALTDLPSLTPFDAMQVDAGAALTYDATTVLAPMTRSLKITATSAAEAAIFWRTFGKLAYTTHGRAYINMSANPGAILRLVQWLAASTSKGFIRITTGGIVQICDQAGTVVGASTALSATTDYRLEWAVTRETGGGGNGVVTLQIFAGHSTTPLQTVVSTAFQTGTYIDEVDFGSVNNSNLGAMALYLGAFADGCTAAVGPYAGTPPAPIVGTRSSDGSIDYGGFQYDGQFRIRARADSIGNPSNYKYRVGQPMFRVSKAGDLLGGPNLLATPGAPVGGLSVPDFAYGVDIGRLGVRGVIIANTNDQTSVTFTRWGNRNLDRTGTDGTTNGAIFTSATIGFKALDLNKALTIAGTVYYITSIDSQTQAHLENADGTPAALGVASGVAWSTSFHPYPNKLDGVGANCATGAIRSAPGAYAVMRSGSDAVVNGTSTLTSASAAFTAADTGRQIMLNNDAGRIYTLTYVNATTVTLDRADPITASGVSWKIASQQGDGVVHPSQIDAGTIGFLTEGAPTVWDPTTGNYAPTSAFVTLASNALYSGGDMPIVMRWRADGRVEIPNRLTLTDPALTTLDNAPKDAQIWRSAASRESHSALIDATALGLASKVKAGTPVDGDWASPPPNGTIVGDSTGLKLLMRLGGSFVDVASSAPTTDTHANRLAAAHVRNHQWLESDTGLLYVDDGTNWQILRRDGSVHKTADQTVNNSNVLVNDTELKFPIEINEFWFLEVFVWGNAASTVADWLLSLAGPTGCTGVWSWISGTNSAWFAQTSGSSPVTTKVPGNTVAAGAAAGDNLLSLAGWFQADATHAGNIQFQWAQNTATAENNTVKKGSFMRLRRLA